MPHLREDRVLACGVSPQGASLAPSRGQECATNTRLTRIKPVFKFAEGEGHRHRSRKQSSERVDGDRGDTPRGTFSGDGTERACGLLSPNAGAGGRARVCSRVKGLFEKSLCKCVSKLSHSSASRPSAPGVGATWRSWRLCASRAFRGAGAQRRALRAAHGHGTHAAGTFGEPRSPVRRRWGRLGG